MRQQSDTGKNVTGITTHPELIEQMIDGARQGGSTSPGDSHSLDEIRCADGQSRAPLGSPPGAPTLKGKALKGLEMLKGNEPAVLFDKLGERLAFERSGVRLYEALLAKHDVFGSWSEGPSRDDLEHFLNEEREHFEMLHQTIEQMGGDATAITPAADAVAVMNEGLFKVVADPRSTLGDSLEALLVVELADNDAWEMLIDLARVYGQDQMADRFQLALEQEQDHLSSVRHWVSSHTLQMAQD
jgi:hypothetical protein